MEPMKIIQMLKNGGNIQQIMMNILKQNNNPMLNNLINLARDGKTEELEKIARNIMQEQGKDFDKEFNSFKQQLEVLNK